MSQNTKLSEYVYIIAWYAIPVILNADYLCCSVVHWKLHMFQNWPIIWHILLSLYLYDQAYIFAFSWSVFVFMLQFSCIQYETANKTGCVWSDTYAALILNTNNCGGWGFTRYLDLDQ